MNSKIKILILALILVGVALVLYFALRKKSSSPKAPVYSCHQWTEQEQAQINNGVPQNQVCANGGNIFTQGANQNYPGCNTCWCCHQEN